MKKINVNKMSNIFKLINFLVFLLAANVAFAGHLFTQGNTNTPTWIQSGTGIAIDQYGLETGQQFSIYLQQPSSTPTVNPPINTANSNWWNWSAGDVMRLSFATTSGTKNFVISYDAGNCTADAFTACGQTDLNSVTSLISTAYGLSLSLPQGSLSQANSYTWTVIAEAGEFSLGGFRIGFANGKVHGSRTGPLNQSSVVSSNSLPPPGRGSSSPSVPPIDTAASQYTVSQLNANQVLPKFAGGTLSIASDGNVASAFTVTSQGGTIDTGANSVNFSGVISDDSGASGAMKKAGAGVLTLSGVNTFTGGVQVEAGKLAISADVNLGASSGGIGLAGGVLQVTDNMSTARAVTLANTSGNGVEVASGKVLTISGAMSGSGGITKSGDGVLALNSGSHSFSGGMIVSAGELKLNSTLGSSGVSVASGARLSGAGVVGGAVSLAGTVAPGNSPGTLSVAGSMTMTPTSTYVAEIDGRVYSASGGAGSYDRIDLTGSTGVFTASGTVMPILRGISAPANNNFDPIYGDRFRIVTTSNASGATGAFNGVTDPGSGMPANSRFDVIYGANYIDLALTPASLASFAAPYGLQNMVNAAQGLDVVRPAQGSNLNNDLGNYFTGLYGLNSQQLASALLQSSGQIHAIALGASRFGGFSQYSRLANLSQLREPSDELWLDATGYGTRLGQDAYASAFHGAGEHIWLGKDMLVHKGHVLGAAVGQLQSRVFDSVSNAASVTNMLAVYLLGRNKLWDYDLTLGYSHSNSEVARTVNLASGAQQNSARPTWHGLTAQAGLGLQHKLSENFSGRAYTRVALDHTRTRAFNETGSSLTALSGGIQQYSTGQLTLGYDLIGRVAVPTAYQDGFWRLGAGATMLPSGTDTFVDRTLGMHGATWSVSEASYKGRTMPFIAASFNQRISPDVNFVISYNLTRSGGVLRRQMGYVGFVFKL